MRRAAAGILAALSLIGTAFAAEGFGSVCSQSNNRVDGATGNFLSDCDQTTYCANNGTCAYRGCRSDEYPFGYNGVDFDQLPPRCPSGQFCPDEGDACQDQIPVGQNCQLDRDDECAPPANGKDLAGSRNTNGTVCLNYVCYYANVTLGQVCINENKAYVAYSNGVGSFAQIISRDNCANGLYCDGSQLQCLKNKATGDKCGANKECLTYNCVDGVCLKATNDPDHPAVWVYILVALGVVILIVGTLSGLFLIHRRNREENQVKLETYYNEQIAYRKSIMSLYQARNSLLMLPKSGQHADRPRSPLIDDSYATQSGYSAGHAGSIMQRRDSSMQDSVSESGDSDALLMSSPNRAHAGSHVQQLR